MMRNILLSLAFWSAIGFVSIADRYLFPEVVADVAIAPWIIPAALAGGSALFGGISGRNRAKEAQRQEREQREYERQQQIAAQQRAEAEWRARNERRRKRGAIFQGLLKAYGLEGRYPAEMFEVQDLPAPPGMPAPPPARSTPVPGASWFDIFGNLFGAGAGAYAGSRSTQTNPTTSGALPFMGSYSTTGYGPGTYRR